MSKINSRKRTPKQCVCCGFNASKGSLYDGKFLCAACESESHGEDEQRYQDEEWAELNRIEQWVGRCDVM